jgi:hypothetical protein
VPEYRSKQARECHVAVCARPESRTVKTVKKEKRSDVQHRRLRVWPQWQRAARRHSVKGRSEQTQGSQAPVCCGHRMIFETGSGAKRLAGCVGGASGATSTTSAERADGECCCASAVDPSSPRVLELAALDAHT